MKSLTAAAICYASLLTPFAAAYPQPLGADSYVANVTEVEGLGRRSGVFGRSTTSQAQAKVKYGKVASGPSNTSKKTQLKPGNTRILNAKRVKVRTGPYLVPSMMTTSWDGKQGMLENYADLEVDKPCEDDCIILRQWADLEYADGSQANVDTGLQLHHLINFVHGPTRWDATCYGKVSLPHFWVLSLPSYSDRLFASGNERSVFDYNPGVSANGLGVPYSGFQLEGDDKLSYVVDLMNMNMEDKSVYISMYYDYLEGTLPEGWSDVKTVWLDAANCGTGDITPPQQTGSFQISSTAWQPNFSGKIIGVTGHVHDGGTIVDVKTNDEMMCRTHTRYAETSRFVYNQMSMDKDSKPARNHISSMTPCANTQVQTLETNQNVQVVGSYDFDKRPGNIEKGKQDEIMAIALMLVAVPPGGVSPPGWTGTVKGYLPTSIGNYLTSSSSDNKVKSK